MRSIARFTILMLLLSLLTGCGTGRKGEPLRTGSGSPAAVETGKEASGEEDTSEEETAPKEEAVPEEGAAIDEDGIYTSRDEVALYIHIYGKLPSNFITKKEAKALGWEGGDLTHFAPGKCIGGSSFGNYEGSLPDKKGRKYFECDIDTLDKKSRGPKRLVYSNDGLIFYTGDHYETFELLYGEE